MMTFLPISFTARRPEECCKTVRNWEDVGQSLDPPFTFLGLPESPGGAEAARVCIWPIPYESTTSYRAGTRNGPQSLLDASRYVETYDEELDWDLTAISIATLPGVGPTLGAAELMMDRIEELAGRIVRPGRMIIAVGGEHAITAPLVRAHARVFPDLTVVQLDAHADLRDTYEGTGAGHASTMRRVNEVAPIVAIGVRSISEEEVSWLRAGEGSRPNPIKLIFAQRMRRQPGLLAERLAELRGNVYLTVDLDVFDPGLVPGVGTPEPGGMTWDGVLDVVSAIVRSGTIVGADVVELAPVPGTVVSEFVAARLVAKLIAYCFGPSTGE